MQVLAHNLLAQFSNRQLNITSNDKKKSAEKLSSGYRINRASDDAAGLKISEKMRSQIRGLKRGEQNIQDGISFIQVADGAMSSMHSMVQRIRELAVQASNDTNTELEREAMQEEISQIKKEINRISLDTEFNKEKVFDNSYIMMDVDGTPHDLNVFNGSYDAATGQVTYGGFLFHGNRITWDQVSPGMVQTDANGNQTFVAGEYTYMDAATGYSFNITCQGGEAVPQMTRNIQIHANAIGINVDGKQFGWKDLKNEDGEGLTPFNIEAGTWTLNYEGADISFFIGNDIETVDEMAAAINSCKDGKVSYSLHTRYVGPFNEQAVDAESSMKNLNISNAFAQYILSNTGVDVIVRAGDGTNGTKDGIWLEESGGGEIPNSFQSWADMGIHSWDQGTDIKRDFTYTFSDTEGINDTLLSFDYTLSDITSVDSVIDGLDHMVLNGDNIRTSYATYVNVPQDTNILSVTSTVKNSVYFLEEKGLGRDFDQKTVPNMSNADVVYDKTNEKAKLDFKAGSTPVISYEGEVAATKASVTGSVQNYLNYVLQKKKTAALAGQDPQSITMSPQKLTDLVGSANITTSGYFDQVVMIDSGTMKLSDGGGTYYQKGEDGKTYPMAFIDFTNLGTTFTLDDLAGTGFNSTCKTCTNHYSVMFVNTLSGGTTTTQGFRYEEKKQGSNNYLLKIDIDSLKANGVSSGADLAAALVDITSECYDFHFTQYASEGSKLYIYDNRESNSGTRDATFDTVPYYTDDIESFGVTMEHADGRSVSINYLYDYGDSAGQVIVTMVQDDAAGDYVKRADGTYAFYNPADYTGAATQPSRFRMNIEYQKKDGSPAADLNETVADYATFALNKMLTNTNVQLDATDYTYIDVKGNEKPNQAVNSEFEAFIKKTAYENVLHIQVSGQTWDCIKIPRISMNTLKMHLYKANVKTWEQAQATIEYADYAINYLSEQRALYGAYQNRLEHAYANNTNAEENTTAAESRLRDADMSAEMVSYSKHNILEQVGQAILAQANQSTQGIMSLLS